MEKVAEVVRARLSRPETVPVEVRLRVTLPASERATEVSAVKVRLADEPAASSLIEVALTPATAVAEALRLSWKPAAGAVSVFATAMVSVTAAAPTWIGPKARTLLVRPAVA